MWLDYACKNRANCDDCFNLAVLYFTTVDFPKCDVTAQMGLQLKIERGSSAHIGGRQKAGNLSTANA